MAEYYSNGKSSSEDAASQRQQPRRSFQRQSSGEPLVRPKGRRPTQYTDSYKPPASFSKFKELRRRSSNLDRSEDDGDHARREKASPDRGYTASPPSTPPSNGSFDDKQHYQSSGGEGLQQSRDTDERRNRSSHRKQASSSKIEPTEQQIAEYAGRRALRRLEQEFADSSAHNNSNNNNSDQSFESFRSVMDRRKLARVPQVKKRDLIIGEYLGRGNFCDVFEVTWILDDNHYHNNLRGARPFSQSVTSRALDGNQNLRGARLFSQSVGDLAWGAESDYALEDLESSTQSLLSTSNDLSLLSDERGGATRTRRSISQVRVVRNQNRISVGSRDPNVLALKCLRPAVRAQPRKFVIGAEDLAHETALLACLDHPNIITLYGRAEGCFSTAFQMRSKSADDYQDDGEGKKMSNEGYFIILDRLMATLTGRIDEWMEECRLISGAGSLVTDDVTSSRIEKIKMPSETNLREHLCKRLKVAYCIADALDYLHSRHVVFRDLKPANVGFDCNDCVKMFDFGFATSIAPLLNQEYKGYGPLTETCGTRRYMAPEVALKLGYGKEVDVYSFGMLLWEICVLEKPFDSIQSVEEFHDQVVLCCKRPSLHVDPLWTPSLKHLMSRCWSTDPLDRPSMMEVKSMLCNVLRDLNVKAIEDRGGSGSGQSQQQHSFVNKWRRRVSI